MRRHRLWPKPAWLVDTQMALKKSIENPKIDEPIHLSDRTIIDSGNPSVNHASNFQAELHYWEQWCRTILVFLGDTPRIPAPTRHLAAKVSTAVAQGNLRGLRTIAGALSKMAQELQFEARERLDAVLESRFGRNLHHVTGCAEIAAHRALKKGRIDTDGEFRLVRSYLSEAAADPARIQQAERIDVLITNYEPEDRRQEDSAVASRTGTRG